MRKYLLIAFTLITINGSSQNTFPPAGNVGIGTTSPAYSLDVNGTGRFGGALTASSFSGSGTGLTGTAAGLSIGGTWQGYNGSNFGRYINAKQGQSNTGFNDIGSDFYATELDSYSGGTIPNAPSNPIYYGAYINVGASSIRGFQIASVYSASNDLYFRGKSDAGFGSWNKIWTSGNFNPANYLPISGGSLSGALTGTSATFTGNIGIGTSNPGIYKLAVEGTLGARKIKVTQASSWSDYVFDSSYQLKPLTEVEQFIKANKHLPDIPSAIQVEKDGIDIGENQAVLLKKIEELTLYMIEMKKQNERLENQVKNQNKRITQLEEMDRK